MSVIIHSLATMKILFLSPRENRAGREPERGAIQLNVLPLPIPLLHFAEEREKHITNPFRNKLRKV
jgi:hypothetical protein